MDAEARKKSTQPYQLIKRGHSWYVRFSIKGQGQTTKALKTKNEQDAHTKAFDAYAEAKHRDKHGLVHQPRSVAWCVEEFLKHLDKEVGGGRFKEYLKRQIDGVLTRYVTGYWADKRCSDVHSREMADYWNWRRSYWLSGPGKDIKLITYMRAGRQIRMPVQTRMRRGPSPSSERTEAVFMRQFFTWCALQGHTNVPPIVALPKVKANKRPGFSAEEFGRLMELSAKRVTDAWPHKRVARDRHILWCYINLLAFSGMRPTEAKNLNWGDLLQYRTTRDLALRDRDVTIRCHGKDKSRQFVPLEAVIPALDGLWEMFELIVGRKPQEADPLFVNKSGERLDSMKNGLTELLVEAGLQKDYRGVNRTAYSFRHFYITQMLIAGSSVFSVAMNCGTSSDMIDKFYAHVSLESMKKELRPEWK